MKKPVTTTKIFLFLAIFTTIQIANGQSSTEVQVLDTRNTNDGPNTYSRRAFFEFKACNVIGVPGSYGYSGMFTFAPWCDNSGNMHHQLNFNDGGIYYRNGLPQNTTWNPWQKLIIKGVNGDVDIDGNLFLQSTEMEGGWLKTNMYYSGHHLVIGSKPGVNFHNNIMIRPGGGTETLVSSLQLYTTPSIGNYNLDVNISSHGITFFNGGNVGIGTTQPAYTLDVLGTIRAREVKVDLLGQADFVFSPNYQLRPLSEVEKYVKANSHLPEIPSAAEVAQNGLSLEEMQNKLLQKIEELTLYTIEQDKKLAEQEKANIELRQRLDEQEKEMKEIKKIIMNK